MVFNLGNNKKKQKSKEVKSGEVILMYLLMPKIHVYKVLNALVHYHGAKTMTLISTLLAIYDVLSPVICPLIAYRKLGSLSDS